MKGGDTIYVRIMVAQTGLEPVRLSATDFKSVVSAYSTTGPYTRLHRSRREHLNPKSFKCWTQIYLYFADSGEVKESWIFSSHLIHDIVPWVMTPIKAFVAYPTTGYHVPCGVN